jgi:hypothetical protein
MESSRALTLLLLLTTPLVACDESPSRPQDGGTVIGKSEMTVNEDLLGVLEVRLLQGRCLGRVAVFSDTTEARAAVIAFAQAVAQPIPLDGSSPMDDDELMALIPGSNVVDDWQEDPDEPNQGPWLTTTNAFDWINGGGEPFQDNGFEAAAGDNYIKADPSWKLSLELVNMSDPVGAETAFRAVEWDQGTAP